MRAPFNVLVIPYRRTAADTLFAVFQRADDAAWQFIAGGGEDAETPLAAARREAHEEAGIATDAPLLPLEARSPVPRSALAGHAHWPADLTAIPEHCFAVELATPTLQLSAEHTHAAWLDHAAALQRLRYASNRLALNELAARLHCAAPSG